ncbi:MAG TPA: heme o synthase [Bacilli bacterium]
MDKSLDTQAGSILVSDSTDPTETRSAHPDKRQASWKDYFYITKPRIIMSNLIATFAGFWLASQWEVDWNRLILALIGATLVMACSCVLNNFLDRELDQKMARTRERPLPSGRLQPMHVFWYGVILGLIGLLVLLQLNVLTAFLGLIGMIVYVGIYTAWLKRTSTLSTIAGAVSGAMPPIIGYCAVSGVMDAGAWILFAILVLWQPPHFWSLGIRRREEYRAAGFQILPVVKGVLRTKIQMIPYVVLLIPTTLLLRYYGYVGNVYFYVALALGLVWLYMCLSGFRAKDDDVWAKKNFMFSINYLMITFIVMIFDTIHP